MTFDIKSTWWGLPLSLRQRWWRETDYGRNPPSDELKAAIISSAPNEGAKLIAQEPGSAA